jgi:hypothetical protein
MPKFMPLSSFDAYGLLYPHMDSTSDSSLIDYGELKREIAEAIRAVIREEADRRGISYEACYDLLLRGIPDEHGK